MLGIEPLEMVLIAVVALFVFGPDRLPTVARQAGRWMRDLRRIVANARRDLDQELGTAGLSMGDLDARRMVQRHVLDGIEEEIAPAKPRSASGPQDTPAPVRRQGAAAPFDADAT